MKKNIKKVIGILQIKYLKCPVFIWLLIAVYETLLLINTLILEPPWYYITSDMGNYIEKSQWFARGIFNEIYTTFYPQGTYYIYAIFFFIFDYFTALHLMAIFQTLCISATFYILYRLTFDLFKSNTVSALAVIGMIMVRSVFDLSRFYLSENLFYLFMLFSLWMIYRIFFEEKPHKNFVIILTAFIVGYAALIRPVILFGYLGIGLYIIFIKGKHIFRKPFILFAVFAVIPIMLQSIYTSILLKRPSFFTSGSGYETFFGLSGYRCITSNSTYGKWTFTNNCYKFDSTIVKEVTFPYPLWENEGWMHEVKKLWKEDRASVLKNILRNNIYLWKPRIVWPNVWRKTSDLGKLFVPITIYAWIIYPLAIFGLWMLSRSNLVKQVSLLLLPVLGLQYSCLFRCGEHRYLLPFLWLIIILSAFGLNWLIGKIINKNNLIEIKEISGKTKTYTGYILTGIILIAFFTPIITWKILTPDPKVVWYKNNEELYQHNYKTLTSLSPCDVWSPSGVVKNSKLFGGTIKVHNFEYPNGFFANNDAELNYKLDGKYDFFESDIGIEQNADPGGSVTFIVKLDGIFVFPVREDGVMQFNTVKYGEEPEHIKLDIRGYKKLTLRTYGDSTLTSWHNRGIWGGPIVYKE